MLTVDLSDSRDLATLGYKQELRRALGSFSAFAAGFSYLSILTGVFQMFHVGFTRGGPAFIWTWPIVLLGQMLVALCFAELAAEFPLSGGVYQWSKRVGSGAVGWIAGWVYLASLVISISAVALALQVTLPEISPRFQIIGDASNEADAALNAVLLGCVLIAFTTAVNSIGVGLLSKINNVGVFAELIGAALLIVLLAAHWRRSPAIVFDTGGIGGGRLLGYLGPFLAAALVSHYVLYGFDTAGCLAEETVHPRKRAPRAILQALAAAGIAGLMLMLVALLSANHFDNIGKTGLPGLVKDVLGDTLGTVFLINVVFAIVVCALAVHTTTVRLMFAMARDNSLPFARGLARVSARSRTPLAPALIAGLAAAGILIVNAGFSGFLDLIVPVAILWANLSYVLVTWPFLVRRFKSRAIHGTAIDKDRFSLGKWGLLVNVLAVVWGVLCVVNIGWPRPEVYGDEWYKQHGATLFTLALVAFGAVYYALVQRQKVGILKEHRPTGQPTASEDEKVTDGEMLARART